MGPLEIINFLNHVNGLDTNVLLGLILAFSGRQSKLHHEQRPALNDHFHKERDANSINNPTTVPRTKDAFNKNGLSIISFRADRRNKHSSNVLIEYIFTYTGYVQMLRYRKLRQVNPQNWDHHRVREQKRESFCFYIIKK